MSYKMLVVSFHFCKYLLAADFNETQNVELFIFHGCKITNEIRYVHITRNISRFLNTKLTVCHARSGGNEGEGKNPHVSMNRCSSRVE